MVIDSLAELAPFLRDNVSSYEQLETLLLLARWPARSWSSDQIAVTLRIPVELSVTTLAKLLATGDLIRLDPEQGPNAFRYAPKSEEIRLRVTQLDQAYGEQRLAIMRLVSTNAVDRIRNSAARGLADGFRSERSKK